MKIDSFSTPRDSCCHYSAEISVDDLEIPKIASYHVRILCTNFIGNGESFVFVFVVSRTSTRQTYRFSIHLCAKLVVVVLGKTFEKFSFWSLFLFFIFPINTFIKLFLFLIYFDVGLGNDKVFLSCFKFIESMKAIKLIAVVQKMREKIRQIGDNLWVLVWF